MSPSTEVQEESNMSPSTEVREESNMSPSPGSARGAKHEPVDPKCRRSQARARRPEEQEESNMSPCKSYLRSVRERTTRLLRAGILELTRKDLRMLSPHIPVQSQDCPRIEKMAPAVPTQRIFPLHEPPPGGPAWAVNAQSLQSRLPG